MEYIVLLNTNIQRRREGVTCAYPTLYHQATILANMMIAVPRKVTVVALDVVFFALVDALLVVVWTSRMDADFAVEASAFLTVKFDVACLAPLFSLLFVNADNLARRTIAEAASA